MLDRIALRNIRPLLELAAGYLHRLRVQADQLTLTGFTVGLFVVPALYFQWYGGALTVILVNRTIDGLDGPLARLTRPTNRGAFLDIVLDFIFYAAVVFGFGLSNPEQNALAASFVLFSFMGTGASFLAFSIMAERLGLTNLRLPQKGFYYLGGLTEGTETILFFVLCCFFPEAFSGLGYFFGSCCLLTTAMRVIYGYRILSATQPQSKGLNTGE